MGTTKNTEFYERRSGDIPIAVLGCAGLGLGVEWRGDGDEVIAAPVAYSPAFVFASTLFMRRKRSVSEVSTTVVSLARVARQVSRVLVN